MRVWLPLLVLILTSCAAVSPPEGPRLVVVVSLDQVRGDMPASMSRFLGDRGLQRIQREGTVYERCLYEQATMLTGPGHAVLLTGEYAAKTGITANDLCDRALGHCLYCAADTAGVPGPFLLQVPTVGDLLVDSDSLSRSVSIGIKDRATVLMGGHHPTAAMWVHKPTGEFTTSAWYAEPWYLDSLINDYGMDQFVNKHWQAQIPDALAPAEDDVSWEGQMFSGRRAFPHVMPDRVSMETVEDLAMSPYGLEMLFNATLDVLEYERLGMDGHPDLLTMAVSSTDYLGHVFGPDSRELQELFVHVDQQIARLIDRLDSTVGREHYVLIVTSDHGVAPIPEMLLADTRPGEPRLDAGRIPYSQLGQTATEALVARYGTPETGEWLWKVHAPSVYFNHEAVESQGIDLSEARRLVANALQQIPGAGISLTYDQLALNQRPEDIDQPTWTRLLNSFHPERCGDVLVYPKRYWILGSDQATHGTPHDYDRWVPLMMLGGGLPATSINDAVEPTLIAQLIRQWWGL